MDEQLATERVASERHHQAVGHLPLRARRLQQISPLRVRRLPLPVETGARVQERLPEHLTLYTKRANCQVER